MTESLFPVVPLRVVYACDRCQVAWSNPRQHHAICPHCDGQIRIQGEPERG